MRVRREDVWGRQRLRIKKFEKISVISEMSEEDNVYRGMRTEEDEDWRKCGLGRWFPEEMRTERNFIWRWRLEEVRIGGEWYPEEMKPGGDEMEEMRFEGDDWGDEIKDQIYVKRNYMSCGHIWENSTRSMSKDVLVIFIQAITVTWRHRCTRMLYARLINRSASRQKAEILQLQGYNYWSEHV